MAQLQADMAQLQADMAEEHVIRESDEKTVADLKVKAAAKRDQFPESPMSGMSSPEAKLGMQVEGLWDVQGAQLSPTEKLNACFECIPVSSFPPAPSSQVIEIKSDTSLPEAVQILSQHRILSAPVVDVAAPPDASWIDRYIGIVEFAGIVVWILHQSELAAVGDASPRRRLPSSKSNGISRTAITASAAAKGLISTIGLDTLSLDTDFENDAAATICGNFFEALTSSEFYKNTKVQDISGSFRWAPFLALQNSNSFLTMLLLLSKYKMKSVPVVDLGDGKIDNIITQPAVIHMLAECVGLHWFENWGTKKLSQLGLPLMKPDQMIMVCEDEPVLQAFKLMRKLRVGGIPVVEDDGRKTVGNISIRDVRFLLTAPEIYKDYRSITAKNFLTAVRTYLKQHHEESPIMGEMATCTRENTMKDVILMLDASKINRIYVVDNGSLEGVITLRDIISKLVHEPHGYFGDFFDGVLPLPQNSRV